MCDRNEQDKHRHKSGKSKKDEKEEASPEYGGRVTDAKDFTPATKKVTGVCVFVGVYHSPSSCVSKRVELECCWRRAFCLFTHPLGCARRRRQSRIMCRATERARKLSPLSFQALRTISYTRSRQEATMKQSGYSSAGKEPGYLEQSAFVQEVFLVYLYKVDIRGCMYVHQS